MENSTTENISLPRVVMSYDDAAKLFPWLGRHPRLLRLVFRLCEMDKVNALHEHNIDRPGAAAFVRGMLEELDIKLRIDNEEVLDHLPEGAFITVSNHHFGALDGIILMDLIASRRPKYKIMVNLILNHIHGMRSNFIAVDPLATDDPEKKAQSMRGLKEAIMQVRSGEPVGFFPAGAVAKIDWKGRLHDLPWQESIIRLIRQMKVPVIPIFFHGSQSWFFNLLGISFWQLRNIRHPNEVFRKRHKTFHITVGEPISWEEQSEHNGSIEELGQFLRERTYALRAEGRKKQKSAK